MMTTAPMMSMALIRICLPRFSRSVNQRATGKLTALSAGDAKILLHSFTKLRARALVSWLGVKLKCLR